jgi:adenylosuccinate lyase
MSAWDEGLNFRKLVEADADIARSLESEKIIQIFDLNVHLRNVGRIFERVFGKDAGKSVRNS